MCAASLVLRAVPLVCAAVQSNRLKIYSSSSLPPRHVPPFPSLPFPPCFLCRIEFSGVSGIQSLRHPVQNGKNGGLSENEMRCLYFFYQTLFCLSSSGASFGSFLVLFNFQHRAFEPRKKKRSIRNPFLVFDQLISSPLSPPKSFWQHL